MLAVEADAISQEAFANTLAIQERELEVIMQHLANLGNQAALIAGFVFIIYTGEIVFDDIPAGPAQDAISVLSLTFSIACFGAMVYVVVSSTITCGLGPIMALKGKDPSAMRLAVQHMKGDRRNIALTFNFGVLCFALDALVLLWNKLYHQLYNAILQTVILSFFLVCLAISAKAQVKRYSITEGEYATGMPQKLRVSEYVKRANQVRKASSEDPAAAVSSGI